MIHLRRIDITIFTCNRFETKKNIFSTKKKSRLASDDCIVGEYGEWGECAGATCGGTGKQYRQRSYKYPDKATKCHRKLFDTKTCTMPRCSHGTNDYFMHVHQTMHLTLLWNNLFPKLFFSKYLIINWWLLSSLKNGTSTENNRRFGFKSLLVFFKKITCLFNFYPYFSLLSTLCFWHISRTR